MKHILFVCLISTIHVEGATRVKAADRVKQSLSNRRSFAGSPPELLALETHDDLVPVSTQLTAAGTTRVKYQQMHNTLPIFSSNIVLEQDKDGSFTTYAYGDFVDGIKEDLLRNKPIEKARLSRSYPKTPKIPDSTETKHPNIEYLTENEVIKIALDSYRVEERQTSFQSTEMLIFLDSTDTAHMAYKVQFQASVGNRIYFPVFIIDAYSGQVLDTWSSMHTTGVTTPGGNLKTGKYVYGEGNKTQLDVLAIGKGYCELSNDDLAVYNLANLKNFPETAYRFRCADGISDEVNGGYGPMADAFYWGQMTFEMYRNYYSTEVYDKKPMQLGVHYGLFEQNAFFNGYVVGFGDGDKEMYPLSSSSNVVAHEISHGFTTITSNLIYAGEPGGIHESFSDMAGEALEFYMTGSVDWKVGSEIMKTTEALRYFDDPMKNGYCIGHIKDFINIMDPHASSGVYSRAFYILSHRKNWNFKMAFDVMQSANAMYWKPTSDFQDGASGCREAAGALGYNILDVLMAFRHVGIVTHGTPPVIQSGIPVQVQGDTGESKYFSLDLYCPTKLTLTISGGCGNVDMYFRSEEIPTRDDYEYASTQSGNNEVIANVSLNEGTHYVLLYGVSLYVGITLTAVY